MRLAELKRRLRVGTRVELINPRSPRQAGVREVSRVQTNAVAFRNADGRESWLDFPTAKHLSGTPTGFIIHDPEDSDFTLEYAWR